MLALLMHQRRLLLLAHMSERLQQEQSEHATCSSVSAALSGMHRRQGLS